MANLNISGFRKIEGLQLGNWKCTLTSEANLMYSFLFEFSPEEQYGEMGFFNVIRIYRIYDDPHGFKVEVDFSIFKPCGNREEFKSVNCRYIYAHELITLDKFKSILAPLLIIHS